jgi:hypothetical protein
MSYASNLYLIVFPFNPERAAERFLVEEQDAFTVWCPFQVSRVKIL